MRHTTRAVLAVFVALAVVASLSGMAAAQPADPTIDDASDIDEGVTIQNFNADADENSTLVVNTDNTDDIEDFELEVSLANEDRDLVSYEADDDSEEYELEEDVDTTDDGTDDSDQHTVTIDHDEFADVPMAINETVNLDAKITVTDANGDDANTTITFALANDDERSVVTVDSDSIDNSDIGVDAETETDEPGMAASLFGAEEETLYDVNAEERNVNGSATDIELHFADADAADAFDEELADDAGDGDVALTMAFAHGEDDTYAVYHEGSDMLTVNLGADDYDDAEAVSVHSSNQAVNALDDIGSAEVEMAFANADLGVTERLGAFGLDGVFLLSDVDADDLVGAVALLAVPASAVTARRQQTAEV